MRKFNLRPLKVVRSFCVTPKQLAELHRIATVEEKSHSEILRQAIELYFSTYREKQEGEQL
jgi:metal-responsive CopG/Arc/MetJ family transcriptional regulator